MKKKVMIRLMIIVGLIISILFIVNIRSMASLKAIINSSTIDAEEGQEVTITLKFDDYKEIKQGINAYKATLKYDKKIFEEIGQEKLICKNDWESLKYNNETGEFVAIKKAGSNAPEEVVEITLTVKEGVKATTTDIEIKDIVTSEGEKDIPIEGTKVTINIIEEQIEKPDPEKPNPEKITSEKYQIVEGEIAKILPETTVDMFKQNVTLENVTTEPQMVFSDNNGKTLQGNDLITTGTKVKIGNTLQYTLIVRGDINCDGKVDITDLAALKLHLISKKLLEGIKLKAADIDQNNEVEANDLAQMKLLIIGLLELK